MKDIEKIIKKFPSLRIAVVGDVMLDRYFIGSVDRISPEAPVPVVSIHKKENRLGGAANVALNIAALGTTPLLFSIIGKDEDGKKLISLLSDSKIDSSGVIQSSNRITSVKTRVLSKNHQMIRFDEEATHDITKSEEENLLNAFQKKIHDEKIDGLIFEDYNKGALTKTLISKLLEIASKKGMMTFADPKRNNFFSFTGVNLFKPNLRETIDALGKNIHPDINDLNEAHLLIGKKLHHQNTLITLGEKGAFLHDGKRGTIIPASIRNVADVSGAGDTVIAVAACAMCSGADLISATQLANTAGGIVCEKPGVVSIELNQLLTEVKSKD